MAVPKFKSDIPSEAWLREKLSMTHADGRNQWGVPNTFGPITGSFDRPLNLPMEVLLAVPGERAEQSNVRPDSLAYIRKNFEQVVQEPVYIEVDPYGKAWMSEGNHRVMVAAERGMKHLQAEVRYFSGSERVATEFSPDRLLAMDAQIAVHHSHTPEPRTEAARLARYIEPGDSFGERTLSDGRVSGAGVVVSVDREIGAVDVRYTSGPLKGKERPEKPESECFSEIVAGRQRREQGELPPEPSLFAIGEELRGAQRVPLYEPVRFGTEDEMASAVLRRGGIGDFYGKPSKAVRTEAGLSFFEAVSAPGNDSTYTYMLVREVGVLDRVAGQVVPSNDGRLVGMTKWDRTEIDQRPGLYYVNATQEGSPQKHALLLGPFAKHQDALLYTHKASNYVAENYRDGVWFSYGTVRLDTTPEAAPRGKLNDVLLTRQERDSLPGAVVQNGQVVEQFMDLIFTMQDAWGLVHANGDEKLKRHWSTLMRSYGDFAEVPAEPSIEGNRQLFAALVDGKSCVTDLFTSESLRKRYARVLEQHAELAVPAEVEPRIRRLAFVNEWSDGLVAHAREHLQGTPDEVLGAMQRAAEDLNLSVLRGGDETLAQRAAATLGFASADDLRHFRRENPLLSTALKAEPALAGGSGLVVGVSSTEVVFATERGPLFFERAWLKADVGVGDAIQVCKFGDVEVTAGASAPVYEPGKKYNGPIPEIKHLPVTAIHRQEMDFRPEVMAVSDEVAAKMDFSAPVDVTAFRYGPDNNDTLPQVTLRDGHHRTAAAIQTGRAHLPVEVTAINAMGEKLNALIAMSRVIEASLEAEAVLSARP